MIKCLGFDKTGACFFGFFLFFFFCYERSGALVNSLTLKKTQTSYGNPQASASLQVQVLMVWGQV